MHRVWKTGTEDRAGGQRNALLRALPNMILTARIMVLRKREFGLVPEFRIPPHDFGCKSLIFIEAENGTEIA